MTYFNYPLSLQIQGPKVASWYADGVWEVQASISNYHNDDREDYKFLDTAKETAVIYLDGFSTASVDEEKLQKPTQMSLWAKHYCNLCGKSKH